MTQKTKGVLLIARNNGQLDYVKQAVFLANRIKEYLNLPVSIMTDSPDYLRSKFNKNVFDQIINIEYNTDQNPRFYFDGSLSYKLTEFRNRMRAKSYNLSPYNETILMDTDYIVSNNTLLKCFMSSADLMMFKKSQDIANVRNSREFKYITDVGIDFYWATVVFFRKTEINEIFFNLIDYIEEEWDHFRSVYQIDTTTFRNDFAFSIAVHIMNGFQSGNFVSQLPGKHLYTIDKDVLLNIKEDRMTFLVEKEKYVGEYTAISTKGQSVHVMNKFSLERSIDV